MQQNISPPFPWTKGVNPEYTAVVVEVHLCQNSVGHVFSHHFVQDEHDETTIQEMASSGQEQIGFALLTEAIRQEAFVQALLKLQGNAAFLDMLRGMPDISPVIQELTSTVAEVLVRQIPNMAMGAVEEVLLRLAQPPQEEEEGVSDPKKEL